MEDIVKQIIVIAGILVILVGVLILQTPPTPIRKYRDEDETEPEADDGSSRHTEE